MDVITAIETRRSIKQFHPQHSMSEADKSKLLSLTLLSPTAFNIQHWRGGFLSSQKEYRRYEKTGFATATGKIELYSKTLEALGYDPLPQYPEPAESLSSRSDVVKDYPFILITGGRHLPFCHSEHRQVPSMRKMHPEPIAQIHHDTAASLGIKDGDWVWIESLRGRISQRSRLFDGMDPRVVHVQHGWWYPGEDGAEPSLHGVWKSNCNVLTNDDPDICNPISGGWPLRTLLCKFYKADEP